MKMERAVFTTLLQEETVVVIIQKFHGHRLKPGLQLHGNIPSCILKGDNSSGEFYSIAISNNYQQVDSGTKMLHLGNNTKSRIISKGVSSGSSSNTYRGQVNIHPKSKNSETLLNVTLFTFN